MIACRMGSSRGSAGGSYTPMYEQLLLFPERAEFLADRRFEAYKVSLGHWARLAETFRDAFQTIHSRGSARVLLVHGGQGHGKSLFVRTLFNDFNASKASRQADDKNLWHVLAGGSPIAAETVRHAVQTTVLRRVEPRTGWLEEERAFAQKDDHEVRVYLFDDAQKDAFVREWAGLTQGEYTRLKADGKQAVAIASVAERIVEDCRGDFRRGLLVLFSNDRGHLDELQTQLDRSHVGLAQRVELPLPVPATKEEIVRTNTNLLNQRSYWFCLDQGGPEEKRDAYRAMKGDGGFTDAFNAIGRALGAQLRGKRSGRPANKNLLTLVTLGTPPSDIGAFLTDFELSPDDVDIHDHLGVWWFRNRWASAISTAAGAESRRASLVESEFSLRWVALDMVAAWVLCKAPTDDQLAAALCETIAAAPSIGDDDTAKQARRTAILGANGGLSARASQPEAAGFAREFKDMGQRRSSVYEPAIAKRMGKPLSLGLAARGALKPDLILGEYEPCEVTSATTADEKAIQKAIRRSCHVIEMTAHLQNDLSGLAGYLNEKIGVYATLLENV